MTYDDALAFWYGRVEVQASKVSAQFTMRAISGISSPFSLSG